MSPSMLEWFVGVDSEGLVRLCFPSLQGWRDAIDTSRILEPVVVCRLPKLPLRRELEQCQKKNDKA